ncbi:MAG: fibronectin type III domain-containing protein [Nitrospirota bacterium]
MPTRLVVFVVTVVMFNGQFAFAAHDSIAPSAPRGVTGHGVSATSIELTWWPSQDNAGIDHYNIYRCQGSSCTGTLVGTADTNYFLDTGLSAQTPYSYTVTAVDPEGRESARSLTLDGYSRSILTHPTGGTETIEITSSPTQVAPGATFSVSWRPTLNYQPGSFGHHDAHFNDSLDTWGCNPPNCWYEVDITSNGGVYSVTSTAPAATKDIYWIPDPHAAGATYNINTHQHYPLARIVVTNGNPLAITTTTLPNATLNTPYSRTIVHNASNEAVGPFACGVSEGRLPNNVLLNSATCVLSGTPTESGSFIFTARVKATSENYAMRRLALTVGTSSDTIPPSPPTGLTVR